MWFQRRLPGARVLVFGLVVMLVCASSAWAQEDPATRPSDEQRRRAAAAYLWAVIILLMLFVVFVAVMIAMRNRLVTRGRLKRPPPTDATDLWSLAARRGSSPKTDEDRPEKRPET